MPPLSPMESTWRPSDDVYQLLAQKSNIPREFAENLLTEFILYWQERGDQKHAWGSKFLKHVIHEWRQHEIRVAQGQSMHIMYSAWQPQPRAFEILIRFGISEKFAKDHLPEFILYWMERGGVSNAWNTRFVAHVRFKARNGHVVSTKDTKIGDQLTDRSWATPGGTNAIQKL